MLDLDFRGNDCSLTHCGAYPLFYTVPFKLHTVGGSVGGSKKAEDILAPLVLQPASVREYVEVHIEQVRVCVCVCVCVCGLV